jgi:hypothetical protein
MSRSARHPNARFALIDYSIPHDRTQRTLTVLADSDTVRIVENNEVLVTHARAWDRGAQIEVPEHLQRLVAEKNRARAHRGLDRLAKAVPSSQSLLRSLDLRHESIGGNTSDSSACSIALAPKPPRTLSSRSSSTTPYTLAPCAKCSTSAAPIADCRPPVTIRLAPDEHRDLVITPHALSTYDALEKDGGHDH